MSKTHTNSPHAQLRVSIVAKPQLVRESLRFLLESNRDFSIVGLASFTPDQSCDTAFDDSDVLVIYFENGDPLEYIQTVHREHPMLRIVAVTDGTDLDNSTSALKFGAVGVVQSVQGSTMLFEAIKQAYNGETWLNQELLNNLLGNGNGAKRAKTNGKHKATGGALTPREIEVIAMIGKGLKSKVIADRLSISEATVRHHLSSIYGKLGVDDRLNLVIYAFERGLIHLNEESN